MSTYTYKLKGARWLRMWTAADRSSVYAAQSEAQKIADTLCDVPWTRAKSDGPAMFPLTAAKSLDENPANRDLFDAALFCADHSDGAHRAYANAAMYLFELPTTTGVHLNSVKVHVESDAYNALGARIAVHLLSSAELPTDCATVRTGAAHAEGVAARRTVERDGRNYWYSNSADVTITGGTSESPAAIGDLKLYLAVFVGLENYATSRNEWLEGASYIRNLIEIKTDAAVTGWTDGATYDCSDAGTAVLLAGGNSPTWLQPMPTVTVGATAQPIPADDPAVETFFAERTESVAVETTVKMTGSTYDSRLNIPKWSTHYSVTFMGDRAVSARLYGIPKSTAYDPASTATEFEIDMDVVSQNTFMAVSPGGVGDANGNLWYLKATLSVSGTTTGNRRSVICNFRFQELPSQDSALADPDTRSHSYVYTAFKNRPYFVYLRLENGTLVDCDYSDSRDEGGRRMESASVTESSTAGIDWLLLIGSTFYNVTKSGTTMTLRTGSATTGTVIGTFTCLFSSSATYFDPAVAVRRFNAAVQDYGLAAAVGDFSHAVATFEQGVQPSNAEVLGRLARMSKKSAQGMLYLHPAVAALADELDVLRPVPKFFRVDGTLPSQTACQPGLSVWYCRPNHATEDTPPATVIEPSGAVAAFAYRNGTVSVVKVTNPAFLQLALLALRAPSAFSTRLVLENVNTGTITVTNNEVDPPTTTETTGRVPVDNHFKLRFVAWRSPAEQWDGSNAFAMAAMASMPSIYRSDGDGSVSWSVDCSGALLRFGVRNMTAERIGVSQTVTGNIAADAQIAIPLVAPVGEGDVVLIAPEVLGFANGAGNASAYFGRQADPAGSGENSAESHNYAWARYPENLGWFPRVTGE